MWLLLIFQRDIYIRAYCVLYNCFCTVRTAAQPQIYLVSYFLLTLLLEWSFVCVPGSQSAASEMETDDKSKVSVTTATVTTVQNLNNKL